MECREVQAQTLCLPQVVYCTEITRLLCIDRLNCGVLSKLQCDGDYFHLVLSLKASGCFVHYCSPTICFKRIQSVYKTQFNAPSCYVWHFMVNRRYNFRVHTWVHTIGLTDGANCRMILSYLHMLFILLYTSQS